MISLIKKKFENLDKTFLIIVVSFVLLNLLNTYFLTTTTLNKYIVTFERTFLGELNAIFGNLLFLCFIVFLISLASKKNKHRVIAFFVLTLALNVLLFCLTIFTKYYGTMFSLQALNLFDNPSPEMGQTIIIEGMLELIRYYRIILFIPSIIFIAFTVVIFRKKQVRHQYVSLRIASLIVIILPLLLMLNLGILNHQIKLWPLDISRSTFISQNIGVYNHLSLEALGFNFRSNNFSVEITDELRQEISQLNKNQESYINVLNGEVFSNVLSINDVENLTLSGSLTNYENLNGIFKGKNLVLFHMESFNYFLLQIPQMQNYFPFLRSLLSESYLMSNFMAGVGIGTTADAEFSVLTGLKPIGNSTLYWDFTTYFENYLPITSLVSLFNKIDFHTVAIHGEDDMFYNRRYVYPLMFGFDRFICLRDFHQMGFTNEQFNHPNPWISDFALAKVINEQINTLQENFFLYPMPMMPHTPFFYDPFLGTDYEVVLPSLWYKLLSDTTIRYLKFAHYIDQTLKAIFINPITNTPFDHGNTVFIFYGDHGSLLCRNDLEVILNRPLTPLEHRKVLNHTISFIYVPGATVNPLTNLYSGQFIGEQTLVRTHPDIFRTVIELFALPIGNEYYFSVNLLSNEPTFSIDSRVMDVITDLNTFSIINPRNYLNPIIHLNKRDYFIRFKQLNDLIILNRWFDYFR